MSLDGTKLQDWALLGKLPRMRSLSVSHSNFSDIGVSHLPLGLARLSLNGTDITDNSMPRLAALNGLSALNIADTQVPPDGLLLLGPSRSLEKL